MRSEAETTQSLKGRWSMATATVAGLALLKICFHLATAYRYGIFRDELYYLACSQHLAAGYVDQPPLIAFVAWFARHAFGDSLLSLRLIPAVCGGATVFVAAQVCRELGGKSFAQILTAAATVAVPIYLILHHWLTMNAWEPLIWLGCIWCLLRTVNHDEPAFLILAGVLAGTGLESKYSIIFLAFALAVGLIATRHRTLFLRPQMWVGALIAILIFLPNLVWLVRNHFPFLELMHNIRSTNRDIVRGPVAFVLDQILLMNPVLAPLWIGGVVWFLLERTGRYRFLGVAYLTLLATIILLRGKNYYLAAIYPALFAGGAVGYEQLTQNSWRWTRVVAFIVIATSIALLAPTVAPIFSPEATIAYQKKLGIEPPKAERQNNGPLPQYFADEFGWEPMVAEVARVYHQLPQGDRLKAAVFANNYGEAGAIDFFGPRYGLPPSICNHQSYWSWGPRDRTGEVVIVLGSNGKGDREHFASVEAAGNVKHPYSRRDEHFTVYVCRGLVRNLQQLWPELKKWN